METIEKAVLDSIKRYPVDFKLKIGLKTWTKQEIINKWYIDDAMRKFIIESYMDRFTHMEARKDRR